MEKREDANAEQLELTAIFNDENEQLKDELEIAREEIARQSARADSAEHALEAVKSARGRVTNDGDTRESELPASGETRYYKKTHSKSSYDVLVRIDGCNHNSWQSAHKADKAKNGVEKLEGTREWKSIQHCGSCKGGGVWRVAW